MNRSENSADRAQNAPEPRPPFAQTERGPHLCGKIRFERILKVACGKRMWYNA